LAGITDGGFGVQPHPRNRVLRVSADDAPGGEQHDVPGTRSADAPQDTGGGEAAEEEDLADAIERRGEGSGVFAVAHCDLHACGGTMPGPVGGQGPAQIRRARRARG
jgi:hypothetical protein